MIVDQAALQSIYRGFKVIFNQAFQAAQSQYEKIATVVPSTTKEELYKWLGKIPRMREWIGDRIIQNLSAYGYTIKNKPFEATIGVDREDIEDDTIGLYNPLVQAMGQAGAQHPDELIFDLLLAGFTGICYDGQYFFDADHKDGNGPVQSNVSNAVLSAASYNAAYAAMMAVTDENGNPLGVTPNLLVVPPQLRATALQILKAERDAAGATNINQNSADVLVVPRLAKNPTAWFLLDTTKPVKPLIFQRRKPLNFVAMFDEKDTNVFMRKEYLYGVDCRDNAGYGLWQMAYGSTGTI